MLYSFRYRSICLLGKGTALKNVLVTGGAGFIGSNFVHYLLSEEPGLRVVNLDGLTYAGSLENLVGLPDPGRHTFVEGDIGDRELIERLLREHSIDTVVHFAAESHVDRSIHGPAPFVDTNVKGTFALLEAARRVWLEDGHQDANGLRFLHVSTDEVYGSLSPDGPAFRETDRYRPSSPYAASKAAADHLARAYEHTYGLPVSITNSSNNYGPRQFPEKLIPLMLLNALEGEPLPIYKDGSQIRDWLYVEDHCRALLVVLNQGAVGETYHIAGDNQPTNLEVVQRLCALLDELVPESPYRPHAELIEFVADRPGHDHRYALDITKITQDLGWRPREDLDGGLRRTIRWYLEHPDWVTAVQQRPSYQEWLRHNYAERETNP